MFRAYSGALSAVGTSACYVICSDDVEQLFFKGICCCLLCYACVGVIEYALFASTSRAHVTACVTADTSGELTLPECESLFRCHLLELFYKVKSAGVCNFFAVLADDLVICCQFLRLACDASVSHNVCFGYGLVTVYSLYCVAVSVRFNSKDTADSFCRYLTALRLSKATEMLHETELSILEISLRCGFQNVRYFIKIFKRQYGVTPYKFKTSR